MKIAISILLTALTLFAKEMSPSDVYSQVTLLKEHAHYILKSYNVKHDHEGIETRVLSHTNLKPRNAFQKTYEIMIKLNVLRETHGMVRIEPVNIAPTLNLHPDLVYEQVRRLLEEFRIFEARSDMKEETYKPMAFKGKTPVGVFNALSAVSEALDEINGGKFTPTYVYAENIRALDDVTLILNALRIEDNTIPAKIKKDATSRDSFDVAIKTLQKIKQLQILSGIEHVDFSEFEKGAHAPSDVFTMTQMILAELQTLKAYLKIDSSTVPAYLSDDKTPVEVNQLMGWNLIKLNQISSLIKEEK